MNNRLKDLKSEFEQFVVEKCSTEECNTTDETEEIILNSELDVLDYDKRWGNYRLKLTENDIVEKEETLKSLLEQSYKLRK